MADVIKSYLISLSANVDKASFDKFTAAMMGAEKQVQSRVGGIVGNFLKFQIAGTTAFATVGFGLIAYIDKLGQADLKTRLLATQNMMSVQQYRAVSMALDTLGVTLNDVFFGTKELQDRFHILIDDQKALMSVVGPDYEARMRDIRDVTFQLQRLEIKGQYFGMKFASDLLERLGFGKGGILLQLENLNDFVLSNMPRWSSEIINDLIPALEQTWDILKKTGDMFLDLSVDFDDFVGTLSGDDSIDRKSASFESFARSISHVAFWVGEAIKLMLGLEKVGVHSVGAIWDLGKFLWNSTGESVAEQKQSLIDLDNAANHAVGAARGFQDIGAAILPGDFYGDKFTSPDSAMRSAIQGETYSNTDFMRLVRAVAQVESGGEQYDRAGNVKIGPPIPGTTERAIGMMQLLPSTAKMLGVNPYDTTQNLQGGEKYLAQLLRTYHGDVDMALAHYGGSGNMSSLDIRDYVHKVESVGGFTIGTIIVNSAPNLTPDQHAHAIKKGVKDAMDEGVREMIVAMNGAYY